MTKLRVVVAIVLGFCAFIVANVADGVLGAARSPTPPMTFVIVGAYLALCQFFVAQKEVGLRSNRATLLGMGTPPVLMFFVGTVLFESHAVFLNQGVPGLLASCLGPLVGAIAARALPARASRA